MYGAARVSEKRDARIESLFFRPFLMGSIREVANFLGVLVLGSHKASQGLKYLVNIYDAKLALLNINI